MPLVELAQRSFSEETVSVAGGDYAVATDWEYGNCDEDEVVCSEVGAGGWVFVGASVKRKAYAVYRAKGWS
jgi:hypothetical protein